MLGQVIGRAIGEATGLNAGARAAGQRYGSMRVVDAEAEGLRDEVRAAPDAAAARRALAGHWLRLHRSRLTLMHMLTADSRSMTVSNAAMLALFDGPDFLDLPMIAMGLRRVADDEPVPVWLGAPAQLVEVAQALVLDGYTTRVAADREHIDVHADGRHVAILLADPGFTVDNDARIPPRVHPKRTLLWLGWVLLFVAMFVFAAGAPTVALVALAAVPLLWLGHVVVRMRRRRRERQHQLSLTPVGAGSPYRGGIASEPVAAPALIAALGQRDLQATRRGSNLVVAGGVVIVGGGAARVDVAAVELRFTDVYRAMQCVHALVAVTGAVTARFRGNVWTVSSPDDYADWEAGRRRDDAQRDALIGGLAMGRARATAVVAAG